MKRRKQESVGELQARGVVGLTKGQMAAALQISVRSLNGMMSRGEVAFYKIGPHLVRFRIEDALGRMSETVLFTVEQGVPTGAGSRKAEMRNTRGNH